MTRENAGDSYEIAAENHILVKQTEESLLLKVLVSIFENVYILLPYLHNLLGVYALLVLVQHATMMKILFFVSSAAVFDAFAFFQLLV